MMATKFLHFFIVKLWNAYLIYEREYKSKIGIAFNGIIFQVRFFKTIFVLRM